MIKDWTIDTCVPYKAIEIDYEAINLLFFILRNRHYIVVDIEDNICTEYRNCLRIAAQNKRDGYEPLKKVLKGLLPDRVKKFSCSLAARHQKKFIEIKFDTSDWPFVAVCSKSHSKDLISEDSDYSEEVMIYLKEEMKINVLSIRGINQHKTFLHS